jgi:cardiolipin synthase
MTTAPLTFDTAPWFSVGHDRVRLLRDGVQAFPAMLEAIASARREVLLEIYWIGDDRVGARFRDALVESAARGVAVKVIYDAVGSMGLGLSFWQPLAEAGGEVQEFHTLWPLEQSFRVDRIERRNHRKVLVVDGERGFAGGINLALPWLPVEEGGGGFRDDMIEVRGRTSEELRTLFHRTWRRLTKEPLPRDLAPLLRIPDRPVWVLTGRRHGRRSIHREYLVRIGRARRSVDIANSYFVPDRSVRAALYRAVARGVRVRVLVPERGDVPIVQYAIEALVDTLLRHGIEIYALPGPVMHAKTAIIDEAFTTIGSYNLDQRSWRKNVELNIAVEDAAFARHASRWFDGDVARARKLELDTWRNRPLLRRGIEWMAWGLRKLW